MAELRRALYILAGATIALFLIVAGLSVYFYLDAKHQRSALAVRVTEGDKNAVALCAFKEDIKERIVEDERSLERTRGIVAEIRSGVRPNIPGLNDADLQRSIDERVRALQRQRRTVRALRARDCPAK